MLTDLEAASHPPLQQPSDRPPLLSSALVELRALGRHRELLWYMVSTSLRTTYSGTFFGYLWWLLDPMLYSAVYILLLDVILKRGGPQFALFVTTSVLVWKFFSSGARNGIGTTQAKTQLMKQVAFPRSVLPVAAVIAEAIRFGFGLLALGVFFALSGVYPDWTFAVVLLVTLVLFIFTLGLTYLLAAVNILFRDTYTLTAYVFQIWFYVSPGLYRLPLVPQNYKWLYNLNPFATILPAYHSLLLYHQMPDFAALGKVAAASLVLLAIGFLVFVRLQRLFAKVQ
jgi:lipopolysaccharide transport system permease protein/teichoic acid transport system permease protein